MTDLSRKRTAFPGTAILVFFAFGLAVVGLDEVAALGVALTFGLVLLALAYSIGPVSGYHVDPAVTPAVLIRISSPAPRQPATGPRTSPEASSSAPCSSS